MAINLAESRTFGANLRDTYRAMVRQKGIAEAETEFRQNISLFNQKHKNSTPQHTRWSLKALAEGIFGDQWYNKIKAGAISAQRGLWETQGAVDISAFSNITGQLLVDRIRANFNAPEFIGDKLFEIVPVVGGNLGTHREPWLSRVKDDPGLIMAQQEYPETQFVEQYIDLPALEKRGLKCSVSLEMIFGDKTKQATQQADDVGYRIRLNREERQLKVVAGIINNWKYMGTTYSTFLPSGLYVNLTTGNQIVNYQGVVNLETLFANMVDLVTGRSIQIDPNAMTILCVPTKLPELKIALHAARTRGGQYPAAGAPTNALQELEGVPLINDVDYPLITSKILWHLLTDAAPYGQAILPANAREYVWMGHFQKAFVYREAMPFTTTQAPPGSPAEFNQDIIVQVKAMEWGVAGVQSPQQVVLSKNV